MYVKYQSELKVELLFFATLRTVGSFNPGGFPFKGSQNQSDKVWDDWKKKKRSLNKLLFDLWSFILENITALDSSLN